MGLVIRRKPVTAEWVIVLDWFSGVLMKVYSLRDLPEGQFAFLSRSAQQALVCLQRNAHLSPDFKSDLSNTLQMRQHQDSHDHITSLRGCSCMWEPPDTILPAGQHELALICG